MAEPWQSPIHTAGGEQPSRGDGEWTITTPPRVGFDFGKQLRTPELRRRLREVGYENGDHIVPADRESPVAEVLKRMRVNGLEEALLVIPDESEPCGWLMAWMEMP